MLNEIFVEEVNPKCVTKEEFVNGLEQLSDHFRKAEQKISVKIDYRILCDYYHLENAVLYTNHSIKTNQCKLNAKQSPELKTKKTATI